jgi:hypothetical protein
MKAIASSRKTRSNNPPAFNAQAFLDSGRAAYQNFPAECGPARVTTDQVLVGALNSMRAPGPSELGASYNRGRRTT